MRIRHFLRCLSERRADATIADLNYNGGAVSIVK